MTAVDPFRALVNRNIELEAEKAELEAMIVAMRADLVSEAIRNEDLRDSLEEATDWAEKREGSERLVARWRRMLADNRTG